MSKLLNFRKDLRALSSPAKAIDSARFFKTAPGEYGEGDVFIGITTPEIRKVVKNYKDLSFSDLDVLIKSEIHEERTAALLILVQQFSTGDNSNKESIYNFYIAHTKNINNWDLVDNSADRIVGAWLIDKDKTILTKLAQSNDIWERRIAMIATFHFIKLGQAKEALMIAEILVNDDHDLIQKAVGWMLREIGKRCSEKIEEAFLLKHYKTMPRTSLRYAIERFPEERRLQYLRGQI